MAIATIVCCQRQKVAVDSHTVRNPDWDSGLSVELTFDVATTGDSVEVTATAKATNVTKSTRDLCVNLHFIAGFKEPQHAPQQADSSNNGPNEFNEIPDTNEIASSAWKKDGKTNCTARSLEPGMSFQDSFRFKYSKNDFEGLKGDIVVMCQVWFQTRVDIPNLSLTCDMERYAYKRVPVPYPSN